MRGNDPAANVTNIVESRASTSRQLTQTHRYK